MKIKFQEIGLVFLSIFLFSYAFNFIWESFHSVFLYQGHNFNAIKYIPMISYVSIIDSLLILSMYIIVSLLWKDVLWIKQMDKKQFFTVIALGMTIAAFIEYRAIFLQDKWSYNSSMPTILGIGLSPLLQLSITAILVIWITRRLVYQNDTYHEK